ncbi:hypothetical protein FZ934_02040 [Rhizobium grahamii]|uniref:Uncharacterized protein n=1 Tax=Rhizobium grahamii TaxID=1120045 RepID=A0A5Q0C0C9_9HYPH|nr:hypothetical protein FZ934_02040 [Rhizobium grahamii]QRM48142.1 hypothetical protein F3Y33_01835 [Rhizobium sp. BG6]
MREQNRQRSKSRARNNQRSPLFLSQPRDRGQNETKSRQSRREVTMGRGILLWLLGVPIPLILIILFFWH